MAEEPNLTSTAPVHPRRTTASPSRHRRRLIAALVASVTAITGVATVSVMSTANASSTTTGVISDTQQPQVQASTDTRSVNLGTKFKSANPGTVGAVQFYRSPMQKKAYSAAFWDANGTLLATATFAASTSPGWQTAQLSKPVTLNKGRWYVVSYLAADGAYAYTENAFANEVTVDGLTVRKAGGVHTYGTQSALPTTAGNGTSYMVDVVFQRSGTSAPTTTAPTNPSDGDWPNAANTGVPNGVTLTDYTGPLRITTAGTVIRNARVNGTLNIQAANVQIINSRIVGGVRLDSPKSSSASFSITDSEVHIPDNLGTGLQGGNFKANRVEVTGGRRSMYCQYNCTIENSWVHAQAGDPGGQAHFSGIRMEQDTTLRHNTITCEAQRGPGTGCSAGLTGYGDFAPIQNNLIENNIFLGGGGGGSTMCAYGGSSGDDGSKPYGNQANNIRFIDNVFVRGASGQCGNLGSIKSFDPTRPGNVWQGNTWDDGTPMSSSGR